MSSLDAYFQVNDFPVESSFSMVQLAQTPKETDYQTMRKKLFDMVINNETDADGTTTTDPEENNELTEVVRNTKKGYEILKKELDNFTLFKRSLEDIHQEIDIIHKNRNDIIHHLREMVSSDHSEDRQKIEADIEALIVKMVAEKETKKSEIASELNKTKQSLQQLQEAFCIHKWCKSYHVCPICLTNEVTLYINPCGHTFCNTCMTRDYCDLCRCRVISKGKLYI